MHVDACFRGIRDTVVENGMVAGVACSLELLTR